MELKNFLNLQEVQEQILDALINGLEKSFSGATEARAR
jgi:hypothetical protein